MTVLSEAKNKDEDVELFPGFPVSAREKVLTYLKNFDVEAAEGKQSEARSAIAYTYSLIERAEEEYARLEEVQREIEHLEKKKGRDKIKRLKDEMKNIKSKLSVLERLSRFADKLVTQQKKRQEIEESTARERQISIEYHSAVLDAMVKAMVLAMIQSGLTKKERVEIFQHFQEFRKRYPAIVTDLESIRTNLFGPPESMAKPMVEAKYAIMDDESPEETYDKMLEEL